MTELRDWYYGIPLFTRYWLSLTVGLSILAKFNLIDFNYFILDIGAFINRFHLWRPATALFYYPITQSTGFHFLVNCYFLYSYSVRLETGIFAGKPADYFTMLIFNWLFCISIGVLIGLSYVMDPMVISVLYVWCQLNKDVTVSFWFGTRFRAMLLPWVLLAFNVIVNGGGVEEFLGILVGHLAVFLNFKYPQEFGGPALLTPPAILILHAYYRKLDPAKTVPAKNWTSVGTSSYTVGTNMTGYYLSQAMSIINTCQVDNPRESEENLHSFRDEQYVIFGCYV